MYLKERDREKERKQKKDKIIQSDKKFLKNEPKNKDIYIKKKMKKN